MRKTPMMDELGKWLSANRRRDGWDGVENEACRLTDDQAMRLCFECSFSHSKFESERAFALAAYQKGRPWDFLSSDAVYPRVVPMRAERI